MMMKKLTPLFLLLACFQLQAQTVLGKWKTIDDKTEKQNLLLKCMKTTEKCTEK